MNLTLPANSATALRLAFRYGINAIDTSPYYYPSEFILGRLLAALAPEYPRSSYYICTKCGRYGPERADFDYSPSKIRSSVEASLKRLGISYLDAVYLHDAEFVVEPVGKGMEAGWEATLATRNDSQGLEARRSLGLAPEDASKSHGPGDEVLLSAVAELFKLKDEGKIHRVGISGYPVPVLLRLSRLVASRPPFRPLDIILSYSNHTLHSDILPAYLDMFEQRPAPTPAEQWTPPMVMNGSAFSMGLLTDSGPPEWHPASQELKDASRAASQALKMESSGANANGVATNGANDPDDTPSLAKTAVLYGIRGAERPLASGKGVYLRTLLGMSSPQQVHDAIHAYRVLTVGAGTSSGKQQQQQGTPTSSTEDDQHLRQMYEQQQRSEKMVREIFERAGVADWSWASPPPGA